MFIANIKLFVVQGEQSLYFSEKYTKYIILFVDKIQRFYY